MEYHIMEVRHIVLYTDCLAHVRYNLLYEYEYP